MSTRSPAQIAAANKWGLAIREGKLRKAAGLPSLAKPKPIAAPKEPKPPREPTLYLPEQMEGPAAFEAGKQRGSATIRKLWRSGWRGREVNDSAHHRGFIEGFEETLRELLD